MDTDRRGSLPRAIALGSGFVALTNAVAIEALGPWPAGGIAARLAHHWFQVLETVALGIAAAAALSVADRLPRSVGRVWTMIAVVAAVAWLLGPFSHRSSVVATTVIGGNSGTWHRAAMEVAIVLGWSAAVGVAWWIGRRWAGPGWTLAVGTILAAIGTAADRMIYGDGYEGMHIVVVSLWGLGWGAAAQPQMIAWLDRGRRLSVVRWLAAGCVALAIVWTPSNATRIELHHERRAAGAWVLAHTVWRLPHVEASELPAVPSVAAPRLTLRRPQSPVVVLLTIDALRGDVLGGAYETAAPNLVRLRDEGAWFSHASATSSATAVSLAGVFTGRYFSQLRWRTYGKGKRRFPYPVDDPSERFPQRLTAGGVRTIARLIPPFIDAAHGIAVGFSDQRVVCPGPCPGPQIADAVLTALASVDDQPTFVFAHLMDPHWPYDRGVVPFGSPRLRYLSEVQYADRELGRIWNALRRRFGGRAYLIVTGDHGEAFGEHGTTLHSATTYEEMVHVPLVMWGPGITPQTRTGRVSLVDIGPTVLALFGLPPDPETMGVDLVPLLATQTDGPPRTIVAEARLKRAVYTPAGLKVIEDPRRKTVEVYDVQADPAELDNLWDTDRARALPALAHARAWFAEHAPRADEMPFRR